MPPQPESSVSVDSSPVWIRRSSDEKQEDDDDVSSNEEEHNELVHELMTEIGLNADEKWNKISSNILPEENGQARHPALDPTAPQQNQNKATSFWPFEPCCPLFARSLHSIRRPARRRRIRVSIPESP